MPIDPGLGGYISTSPVPVDPILIGQQQYTPPISSGEPAETIPPMIQPLPAYSSVPRVVQAYKQGLITYNQAYSILMEQFGYSGLDATDVLGVESETVVAQQQLTPQLVSDPAVTVDVAPAAAAADYPADFALVGLVAVLGALWLFFVRE